MFTSSSIDERVQRKALDSYYKEIGLKAKNKARIERCKKFARVDYPIFCVIFVILFSVSGMNQYYNA